jgi:surface antigen
MIKKIPKLIIALLLLASFISVRPVYATSLDDLYQQKQDLQNSISANSQNIKNLQGMVQGLDAQTAATEKEINITNQIISLTDQQIADTQVQIDQKQKELDQKKADLYQTIVTYYENGGDQSTVEIIASSNNLSDLIDQSQYMQALADQINTQAEAITKAKADLETQKNDLQKKEADLETQKTSLADQQRNLKIQASEKGRLLSQANSKQSQLQGDLDNVSATIYAQREALGGSGGGTGGYPFADSAPDQPDPWGFYTRECTSYAAWYFNAIEGKSWYNTRPGSGSAYNWPALAADQGYSVSSTPRVGAIASWPAGGIFGSYGHVAIVRSVNGDGTINVSDYNWIPYAYYEHTVSSAGARFIF